MVFCVVFSQVFIFQDGFGLIGRGWFDLGILGFGRRWFVFFFFGVGHFFQNGVVFVDAVMNFHLCLDPLSNSFMSL